MSSEELIPAGEFCTFHHVELAFLQNLHDSGLIALVSHDGVFFLDAGELAVVEKFARWHYELAINAEGIEALSHMLDRVDRLMAENSRLRTRLHWYEGAADDRTADGITLE
jgi:hypothetical protein